MPKKLSKIVGDALFPITHFLEKRAVKRMYYAALAELLDGKEEEADTRASMIRNDLTIAETAYRLENANNCAWNATIRGALSNQELDYLRQVNLAYGFRPELVHNEWLFRQAA